MLRISKLYPKLAARRTLHKLADEMLEESKSSAVNVVDPPAEGDVGGQEAVSFPSEFPAGEVQQKAVEGPELLQYGRTRSFDSAKEADVGVSLGELTTDEIALRPDQDQTQHGQWNHSYTDTNKFEDTDKLGETQDQLEHAVYPPYTSEGGVFDERYMDTDRSEYNVTKGADKAHPWIAVDLDGTILESPKSHEKSNGQQEFGTPIQGAREALQELIDGGARVSIWTARQYFTEGEDGEKDLTSQIELYLDSQGIPFTDVYIGKKPPADVFIDNAAVNFEGDWSLALDTVRDKLTKRSVKATWAEIKKIAQPPVRGKFKLGDLKIHIEWPKGSIRSYKGEDTYVTLMRCHYGYIKGVEGSDGMSLDCYVGDDDTSDRIFIIDQLKPDGSYDEEKVMIGFPNKGSAVDMYLEHMPAYTLGEVREVSLEKFSNAIYGEPEDRRDEDDLVPQEEVERAEAEDLPGFSLNPTNMEKQYKDHDRKMGDKTAAYSDLAMKALSNIGNDQVYGLLEQFVDPSGGPATIVDEIVRTMLRNPEFKNELEEILGSAEDPPERREQIDRALSRFKPQKQGPSGTQKIETDKESNVLIDSFISQDDNVFTDPLENRLDYSIDRSPDDEHAKYRGR